MPAPINAAYLVTYLSGGSGNTSADASLGGIISSTRVLSQTVTPQSAVPGVTFIDGAGNTEGTTGTLVFTFNATTGHTLQWVPPGGAIGNAVVVSTAAGDYFIQGSTASGSLAGIFVTVTPASLPAASQNFSNITVTNLNNKVWSDVTKDQAFDGDTAYRCLYVKNTHPTDAIRSLSIWRVFDSPGADVYNMDLDTAGVGDGSATGVANNTFGANKTISGVTWSAGVATYTATAHGYSTGNKVRISGITPSGYNGDKVITVTGANTFTAPVLINPGAYSAGGVANLLSAPSGVLFTANPISEGTALSAGNLGPGQAVAFWIQRVVPSGTTTPTPKNGWRSAYKALM
jgi:hypothetical protein